MKYEEYAARTSAIRPEPSTPEWEAYWKKDIELSQQVTHYEVEGKEYLRIPYGNEDDHLPFDIFMQQTQGGIFSHANTAKKYACHDCNVVKGQLHVPGCDVEICPKCYGQAISCECVSEDDAKEQNNESAKAELLCSHS